MKKAESDTLKYLMSIFIGLIILLALLYPLKGFAGIFFGSNNPVCLSEEAKNVIDRISSNLDGLNINEYGDDVIRLEQEECAFVLYSKDGELKTPPEEVFQKSAICVCEYDNDKCTANRYCKEVKDANVLVDTDQGTNIILFNKVQIIPIYFKRETDKVLFSTKPLGSTTTLTNALSNSLITPEGKMSVLLQGQPSISVDVIRAELEKYNSPAKDYADLIYNLGIQYGIDPAISLAFFFKESNYGTKGIATITKGFGNMRPGSSWTGDVYVSPNSGSFRKYSSWEDSIRDWYELIKNSNNYVGGGKTTVEEIVPVYAPAPTNDVPLYVETVRDQVAKYQQASGNTEVKSSIGSCEFEPVTYKLNDGRVVNLPTTGPVIQESHYVTIEDSMPSTVTDNIQKHLDRSCNLMSELFGISTSVCPEIYKLTWQKQWTPAESGMIGQNARSIKMPIRDEMFLGTMFFSGKSNMPPIGEKWILKNPANGKAVVLAMGYEVGPRSSKLLAGTPIESFYFLSADNQAVLQLGKAKDQSLQTGPIDCTSSSSQQAVSNLIYPLDKVVVTSCYGSRSLSGSEDWHDGIDFSASEGTQVKSVADGTIFKFCNGYCSGYGNNIIIKHSDNFFTRYDHLSEIKKSFGSVSQGEVIGLSGNTGHSTGPHLDFKVYLSENFAGDVDKPSYARDPLNFLPKLNPYIFTGASCKTSPTVAKLKDQGYNVQV